MFEELKNIIDKEYDKVEASSDYEIQNVINAQVEGQNKKSEEDKRSELVNNYLKAHNKESMDELSSEEINELLASIDNEIKNME